MSSTLVNLSEFPLALVFTEQSSLWDGIIPDVFIHRISALQLQRFYVTERARMLRAAGLPVQKVAFIIDERVAFYADPYAIRVFYAQARDIHIGPSWSNSTKEYVNKVSRTPFKF